MSNIGAEIRRLQQIKSSLEWNDAVGLSFDALFAKLELLGDKMDNALSQLDDKLKEVATRVPLNELEDMYTALMRIYVEADA